MLIKSAILNIFASNLNPLFIAQFSMLYIFTFFENPFFFDFYEIFQKSCKKPLNQICIPLFSHFKDTFAASKFENCLNINFLLYYFYLAWHLLIQYRILNNFKYFWLIYEDFCFKNEQFLKILVQFFEYGWKSGKISQIQQNKISIN